MQYIIYFFLLIVGNAEKSMKVDIYPGFGWDHLRFIDMSPVFDVSNFNNSDVFQSCIELIPLHENKIETGSTVIDAFDSRTTDYSTSFLLGGSGVFKAVKIAEKRLHKAAAEISFLNTYSLTSSFSSAHNDTEVNEHKQNINRKVIHSKGGDVFISGNHLEAWQLSVKSRPAIIRRAIENMTYFIQSEKLPELTDIALGHVRQKINDAIDTYIEMNAIRGCMHRDSSSFNWIANVDDGSCAAADQTSQFGGFIRTCQEEEGLISKCDSYRIDNFYTGNNQCKSGFEKYLLHKSIQIEQIFRQDCYGCGFFWLSTCCDNIPIGTGQRELNLYNCNQNITQNSLSSSANDADLMHVYGGSFTSKKVNPVTNSFSCPTDFSEVNAFDDMKLCLTEKIESHLTTLPRYGGMFSCDYGNIATETGGKTCPIGYSVYVMGAIDGDCLLNVCLKFETFNEIRNFPMVVLPPFFDIELVNRTTEINETMGNGEIMGKMRNNLRSASSSGKSHKVELGLSIGGAFIGVLAIAAVGFFQVKKYRKRHANNLNDSNNVDLAIIKT